MHAASPYIGREGSMQIMLPIRIVDVHHVITNNAVTDM